MQCRYFRLDGWDHPIFEMRFTDPRGHQHIRLHCAEHDPSEFVARDVPPGWEFTLDGKVFDGVKVTEVEIAEEEWLVAAPRGWR